MQRTLVETVELRVETDIVFARQAVRALARSLGFGASRTTRVVTATSELARNTLEHGGGGSMRLEQFADAGCLGLRATFADDGPGIPDVEQALADGYTTGSGLGLGLGGARRLVETFEVSSAPGRGTAVTIEERA